MALRQQHLRYFCTLQLDKSDIVDSWDNNISDISALSNLTNLRSLDLDYNSISDISALSNLTSLTRLYLQNNSISDISPLVANTGLGSGDFVTLSNNPLSSTSINTHIPALQLRSVTVEFDSISGSPDLIVESPLVSDNMLITGQSFTLHATVRNQGNGQSAATTLQYYRSTDAAITSNDSPVGADSVSGLSAGNTSDESVTLSAPLSAGTYYYGACVQSISGERDTNNNCSDGVRVLVSSSSGGDNTYGGGELLPNFPSGFFFPIQLSRANLSFATGRAVLSFDNGGVMVLQDGTTYTCIASEGCGVEAGRVTSGTISVIGPSDGGSSPDLIVISLSVSDNTLTTGQSFTLHATVRNQGNGQSAPTTLRYYRSMNATITTSDSPVGSDFVNGLSASGTSTKLISVTAPSNAGIYYYGACVQSVNGESDTDNNCSTGMRVTVSRRGSPDLIVESPSVSNSSLTLGQSFTLSAKVRNRGSAQSAPTTLRYYRSMNTTITTSDSPVGSDSVNGLSASGTSAESISLNAPSNAGTYYYGACVQSVSGERNTNNNCSTGVSVSVNISPPPAPNNVRYQWVKEESYYQISWEPSPDATHYDIYFDGRTIGNPNYGDSMQIGSDVTETTFPHSGEGRQRIGYWVQACNRAGCSDPVRASEVK